MVQAKNERRSKKISPPVADGIRPATSVRHEHLRRQLLAAATAFIAANGLAELRARDLAQNVGCSVGAIYNVFADLDALILAVNAQTLQAIGRQGGGVAAGTPQQQFMALANTYLDFAVSNRRLWDALFTHRLPKSAEAPDWFVATQNATFSYIETPLRQLRPDLPEASIPLLARSIFAAVHGIVALGLEHRTGPIDLPSLREQLTTLARAMALGLAAERAGTAGK
jgi:AcrR family transcriptional regulator